MKDLICIYVDANGLHEINNTKGHLAGDEMLKYIANTLKIIFGENEVYRIGGDEFVIFQRKKTETQIQEMLTQVHDATAKENYHVSCGFCTGGQESELKDMIKKAEIRMYEEKQEYYKQLGQKVRNTI